MTSRERVLAALHRKEPDPVPYVVDRTMNEVVVTRQYKALVAQYQAIPFVKGESVDIDQYVVTKSLDGLFHVLGVEERKIRTNPSARVTDLLKEVFAK